jgi:hypothetical protein
MAGLNIYELGGRCRFCSGKGAGEKRKNPPNQLLYKYLLSYFKAGQGAEGGPIGNMESDMKSSGIRNQGWERCGRESMIGVKDPIVSRPTATQTAGVFFSDVSCKTNSELSKSN